MDYTSSPITATFIAETTSTRIDVPVIKDNIGEGLETFDLNFTIIPSSPSDVEPGHITQLLAKLLIQQVTILVNLEHYL